MGAFRTVLHRAEGEIVEKKSRFIATVLPVETEGEAEAFLNELRKKYWDANHNVYAYRVGQKKMIERFSDDGEPAHTAGMPVLSVLQKEDIRNVCVVVTRYFGGTLLGTGGLVRAYSKAAQEALKAGLVIQKEEYARCRIDMDYTLLGKMQYGLLQEGFTILDTEYTDCVSMRLLVPQVDQARFERGVIEMSDGKLKPVEEGRVWAAQAEGTWHYFDPPAEK